MTDLETFVGILILSSYNVRTDQKDDWPKDEDPRCNAVTKAMIRNQFFKIKSKLKFSKSSSNC